MTYLNTNSLTTAITHNITEAFITVARQNDIAAVNQFINTHGTSLIDSQDNSGQTALMRAAWRGQLSMVEHLIAKGANIHQRDNNEYTALILAAMEGHADTVSLLIDKGADVHAVEADGWSAADYAEHGGYTAVTKLLRDGTNLDADDMKAGLRQPLLTGKRLALRRLS